MKIYLYRNYYFLVHKKQIKDFWSNEKASLDDNYFALTVVSNYSYYSNINKMELIDEIEL